MMHLEAVLLNDGWARTCDPTPHTAGNERHHVVVLLFTSLHPVCSCLLLRSCNQRASHRRY